MQRREKNSIIDKKRHSLAHLLAAAVLKKFPSAKLGIGPTVENGFYYDFLLPRSLMPDDLKEFETTMRDFIKRGIPFSGKKITHAEINKLFKDQPFKLELIEDFIKQRKPLTIYITGNLPKKASKKSLLNSKFYILNSLFVDLCRGGHVKNTKEINPNSFKLTNVAGAYWQGNENNKMLTRIYGVAFENKEELDKYLWVLEEAKKRDHRKLGQQLDLFTFSELIGSGLPLYTPKGALVRRLLNECIEKLQLKAGYNQVWTPQIAKAELFKTSGHYNKYKGDMFRVVSNYSKEEFYLKPMSCPQHTQIYNSQMRSYRDLPIRYTDFAMLYRDEKPGELNGLARVRSFSQDDCHVFCRENQVDKEIDTMLSMTKKIMEMFGFKYRYRLSIRDKKHPEKYIGDPKTWVKVEKWAEKIMKRNKIDYFDGPGEAAFYAPKMDLMATDALGREWQLSTVQIDFFTPKRFGLTYIDENGKKKCPVMIHRAIMGSPERFIMVLLEHFAGALPLWLAPVQVKVLAVSDKQKDYAKDIYQKLTEANVRTEIAPSDETLGKRIREAEMQKVPYIAVVGDEEMKKGTVNLRVRGKGAGGEYPIDDFIKNIQQEVKKYIS